MLFITTKQGEEIGIHLPLPLSKTLPISVEDVDEIQADGDELEHILSNLSNIPYSYKNKVQTWRGDFARFIFQNW